MKEIIMTIILEDNPEKSKKVITKKKMTEKIK